ncbi:uncharacterized protein LOC123533440 [Mercenaria mercenaria]|uniref:uncharacterized protein LOC123533440 n=1 Tax=Mercenaria mercenaria TaxID=6596 RepID=UPI00234EFBD6|nr:uncharacterized protein LOC123533440 [Mercenaria mercenaria]
MAEGGRNLRINPFSVDEDHIATGEKWDEWLNELEREMRFFRVIDAEDKKDAMLIYGGVEIRRLDKSLQDPGGEGDVYSKLKSKLTDYFAPKKNIHFCRYVFLKTRPQPGENTVSYAARLREKAKNCDFHDCDERILEHIIQTTENEELVRKVLYKKWTLQQTLNEMQLLEETSIQVKAIGQHDTGEVAKISRKGNNRYNGTKQDWKHEVESCKYCDRKHPKQKELCPAYGKKCGKCGRYNHFAAVCRSTRDQRRQFEGNRETRKVAKRDIKRAINESETEDSGSDTDKDNFFLEESVKHLAVGKIKVSKVSDHEKTVPIELNDVIVLVEPDSGADVNVMDEHQNRAFQRKTGESIILHESKTKLSTLQNELPVSGEFKATARNKTRGIKTVFIVVKGKINSPPLLGRKSLTELGMLDIRPDGSLREQNELRMRDRGDPEATPVAQKPRPVPYYLQEPLKTWLDECIKEEIFEEVESGEPVTWCSPLVVQPKPRYTNVGKGNLEPHMIRASVDLRVPNKYMERNRILQAPVVEDFTCKFHDCKVFSKMDLRQGYRQLVLHPDSRVIATFSTPWGNMRPKRLIFGAKSSQDLFDEAMFRIFGDIPNCLNQRDDILIGGVTMEEHNKTLATVLQRAQDFGVTLNKEKCQFGVKELEFYGYRFTNEGLKPAVNKVNAVKDCEPPKSRDEVRSFLGMIGYLSKFISRYSVLTAPLRRLTGQDVPFTWGREEDKAFQRLKDSITSEATMAFFNPRKQIIVRTEASFHEGLSAGKINKWSPPYEKEHYEIIKIRGSTIGARRKSDERTIYRDASKFKQLLGSRSENWRERLLRSTNQNQQTAPEQKREYTENDRDRTMKIK